MRSQTVCALAYAVVIIACLSCGIATAEGTQEDSNRTAPSVKFPEVVYDFDTITPTQKVTHVFEFHNLGGRALKIDRVITSCGCTAAVLSTSTVPPGRSGEIKVTFNPEGYRGPFQKVIYVHLNDPQHPVVALQIKGFVRATVYVIPQRLDFGEVKRGMPVDTTLVVVDDRERGERLEITGVESDMKYIHLSPGKPQSQQSGRVTIPIAVNLNSLIPVGKLQGRIKVRTNTPEPPVIVVPVTIDVVDEIVASPERLFFGFVQRGDTPSRKITVYSRWKLRFKVLKVESPLPFLATQISTIEETRRYEVVVSIRRDAPKGRAEGAVKIYTDYPGQPVIEVPVVGLIGE